MVSDITSFIASDEAGGMFRVLTASSNAPLPFVSNLLFSKCDKTACFPIRADE